MANEEQDPRKHQDPRVGGLVTVGWISLAMLGICIPLMPLIGAFAGPWAAFLPLTVIVGGAMMGWKIWTSGTEHVANRDSREMLDRIDDLEQRLGNLEMIESVEAHFAEKNRRKAESGLMGSERDQAQPAVQDQVQADARVASE